VAATRACAVRRRFWVGAFRSCTVRPNSRSVAFSPPRVTPHPHTRATGSGRSGAAWLPRQAFCAYGRATSREFDRIDSIAEKELRLRAFITGHGRLLTMLPDPDIVTASKGIAHGIGSHL
jgi:hypothetical protein